MGTSSRFRMKRVVWRTLSHNARLLSHATPPLPFKNFLPAEVRCQKWFFCTQLLHLVVVHAWWCCSQLLEKWQRWGWCHSRFDCGSDTSQIHICNGKKLDQTRLPLWLTQIHATKLKWIWNMQFKKKCLACSIQKCTRFCPQVVFLNEQTLGSCAKLHKDCSIRFLHALHFQITKIGNFEKSTIDVQLHAMGSFTFFITLPCVQVWMQQPQSTSKIHVSSTVDVHHRRPQFLRVSSVIAQTFPEHSKNLIGIWGQSDKTCPQCAHCQMQLIEHLVRQHNARDFKSQNVSIWGKVQCEKANKEGQRKTECA